MTAGAYYIDPERNLRDRNFDPTLDPEHPWALPLQLHAVRASGRQDAQRPVLRRVLSLGTVSGMPARAHGPRRETLGGRQTLWMADAVPHRVRPREPLHDR